jgi:hypothetical protein
MASIECRMTASFHTIQTTTLVKLGRIHFCFLLSAF